MTDLAKQPTLTTTEQRMLRVARAFAAEGRLAEQGKPVRESRLIDLVLRMSAVRQPVERPKDREVQPAQPSSRRPRNRRPASNMPAEIPDGPSEAAGGRECGAVECFESSVGWRFYRGVGWLAACTRHMSGAGPAIRRMDGDRVPMFGPGDAGVESGAVCPPAASNPPTQARGASAAQRPAGGPSGAFPAPEDGRPVQEAPGKPGPQPPGGPTGQGSPSGPTWSAAAHTEPYSASGPQAASQAVQA